jgi:hypothetical protein
MVSHLCTVVEDVRSGHALSPLDAGDGVTGFKSTWIAITRYNHSHCASVRKYSHESFFQFASRACRQQLKQITI